LSKFFLELKKIRLGSWIQNLFYFLIAIFTWGFIGTIFLSVFWNSNYNGFIIKIPLQVLLFIGFIFFIFAIIYRNGNKKQKGQSLHDWWKAKYYKTFFTYGFLIIFSSWLYYFIFTILSE